MALITCPECGGKVSDKAEACPHCGYPLKENIGTNAEKTPTAYALVIDDVPIGNNVKINCIKIIMKHMNLSLADSKKLCDDIPNEGRVILKSKSKDELELLNKDLNNAGGKTHIKEIAYSELPQENAVKCPRCGSTQITTGQRGYSIMWGPLGSNKTVNRCAKCGYTWDPSKP